MVSAFQVLPAASGAISRNRIGEAMKTLAMRAIETAR
jgi:hypothetical protein